MSARASRPAGPAGGPLAGLKVIDLTAVLMGPYATQMLGDMGADVIKIEAPGGDVVRLIGPSRNEGMGPVFLNANRSKRSVELDLKNAEGRRVLLRLAEDADILVYNIRPQAMARLGLDYASLREVNPGLIYAGVFGYGQDGPYAAMPAYDDLIQGACTLAAMVGQSRGEAPGYVPLAMVDRITGMAAVNAVLAALHERQRSGQGQRIDVPMFETMVAFVLSDHLAGLSFDPPLDAGGYARLLSPARRPYRTRDGHLCALVYTDKQWRSFYRLLGREAELDADPRMASLATRSEHIDEIYAELERTLASRTTAQWLALFRAADIPATPVHDLQSIFDDPHLCETGFFGREVHPTEGPLRTLRHPSQWSRTQPESHRAAPRLGEHGEEVLREAGYAAEEIERLVRAGVLGGTHHEKGEHVGL
ncbi:CoA transferase [Verticiella sediminum]|uniref:CoA transferase n=1 Tax=Verticiella sediminum TaxID=1247510 RepID=A0A556B229_9BURK|nr:CoA transferase [Verticiella sediminum]TSH98815.1 CoA transferase [Verticiella sediminum]